MDIKEITELPTIGGNTIRTLFEKDENGREILISHLQQVQFVGDNLFYPNVMAHSKLDNTTYRVIREKTMSLGDVIHNKPSINETTKVEDTPVFFFTYNTDNYFHFVYDTLPYLITYNILKETNHSIKLLMNYPNPQATEFYRFVSEFLELFGITEDDILIIDGDTEYSNVYTSSSYTHDIDSNLPPRKEVYILFKKLVDSHSHVIINNPSKKIYISRRSWIHNDFSNIGTNYTNRRKLAEENELVEYLESIGFTEVFTENLSTLEKLVLFSQAEVVVGSIGGGLCNVLFSPKETKLITIVSPTFLDVNNRFRYSLDHVDNHYYMDSKHIETTDFKTFMRVNCPSKGIVGEITKVGNGTIDVSYSDEKVSGWNAQNEFKTITLEQDLCEKLDEGLNACWSMDLDKFKLLV